MDERQVIDRMIKTVNEKAKDGEFSGTKSEAPDAFCCFKSEGSSGSFEKSPADPAEYYMAVLTATGDRGQHTDCFEKALIEMRNALSVSFAASSALSDGLEDRKEKHLLNCLAMIRHSQHRLLDIIGSLENIIAYEKGQLILEPKPTDINALCRNLVNTALVLLSNTETLLDYSCRTGSAVIMADRAKAEAMLLDLICCGVKNTPGGELNLILSKSAGYVIITLTGIGSGAETQENNKSRTGISGLSDICAFKMRSAQNTARLHGGNIFTGISGNGEVFCSVALPDRLPDGIESAPPAADDMRGVLTGLAEVLDHTRYMAPFDE